MKKIFLMVLTIAMIISFAACGDEKESKDSVNLDVDTVSVPENTIDFEVEDAQLTSVDTEAAATDEAETKESSGGNSIVLSDIEIPSFSIEAVSVGNNTIDFEIEPFEFEFDIEPVEVQQVLIDFEPAEFKLDLAENFAQADMATIDDLTEDELIQIATTRATLLHNLKIAFQQVGLSVQINEASGEIALDSAVLFGGDSAELTQDGMEFLQKFITVYSTVVLSEEFEGFISSVLVEGHTAPVAGETYESSLPLSEERAENVKAFCIDSANGLDAEKIAALQEMLEPVGYSNTKPVLDADGNVDMAASRRVAFRFLINID